MTNGFIVTTTGARRKRVVLTLEKKLEIIKKAKDGISNESLSAQYNVGMTTVHDIKNKDKTLAFTQNSSSPAFLKYRKVMKETGCHKELDALLYDFVDQQCSQGIVVYASNLLSKVEEIQRTHNLPEPFCPSLSWINRFKKRYGFTDQQISNDPSNHGVREEEDELNNGLHKERNNSLVIANCSTDDVSNNESESLHPVTAKESGSPVLPEGEIKMEPSQSEESPEEKQQKNPQIELTKKREDYICWADYFMAVASLTALRSKDPNSQVGACIVNEENKIVGVGYNGMPNGCSDDYLPWAREADDVLDTKYPYVCHAEMNAICNKNCADLKGCIIYVALFPCNECAKLIIQSRIKEVVYMSDKYYNTPNVIAAKKLFDMAGVIYRQHHPIHSKIVIDLNKINNSAQS